MDESTKLSHFHFPKHVIILDSFSITSYDLLWKKDELFTAIFSGTLSEGKLQRIILLARSLHSVWAECFFLFVTD